MVEKLDLKPADYDLYLPRPAKITAIKTFNPLEKLFCLALENGEPLGNVPGQFVMVTILGYGEAPISISSFPRKDAKFELCVRAVGSLTDKMHTLSVGDVLHVRGPFGNGFDNTLLDKFKDKHLLFLAGGIGLFPLRSLINTVIPDRKNYKKISVLYGCKTPKDRTFCDELEAISKIGENVELLETVDQGDPSWKGNVGVITTLVPKVKLDPQSTIGIMVGPPVMFKFALIALMDRDIPASNIYMSLERRMKCGVGKCGHCQMGCEYVCQEGPVFNYADVMGNEEAL